MRTGTSAWGVVTWLVAFACLQAPTPAAAQAEGWEQALYARARDSVVLIETDEGVGSGFYFHSAQHVATAFHVVRGADWVLVRDADGGVQKASVVAYDVERDLALLGLQHPGHKVVPLLPALNALQVGAPVVAIGHPMSSVARDEVRLQGLLEWSLSRGIISAVSSDFVQTDAAVNPGNSGGPLLDASGRVVGVVSFQLRRSQGLNVAARASHLQALTERIGTQPPPPSDDVERDAFELGYAAHYDGDDIGGLLLGVGGIYQRRYVTRLRLLFVSADVDPRGDNEIFRSLERSSLELEWGYRLGFGAPPSALSVTGTFGLAVHYEQRRRQTISFDESNGTLSATTERHGEGKLRLTPMLGATVTLWLLRLGYAAQLNFTGDTIHRLLVTAAL